MRNINDLHSRYLNDPEFHSLVNMFRNIMKSNNFTITELKDGLMYAAFKYEQEVIRPIFVNNKGEINFK